MTEQAEFMHVPGGRIEVWRRDDGLFGVSLLPDEGQEDYPGYTYTSTEDNLPGDFPSSYDLEALKAWGRARWGERLRPW
jgi:hypothetical protein